MLNLHPHDHSHHDTHKTPVDELKDLLSSEHTSINSFEHCLETPAAAGLHTVSAACRDLHAVNVQVISERLAAHGVDQKHSTDLWHSFLELISTTTSVFGEDAILAALRKHEAALYMDYQARLATVEGENLQLLQETLLPNQEKVLELLGAIKSEDTDGTPNPGMPLNLNWAS